MKILKRFTGLLLAMEVVSLFCLHVTAQTTRAPSVTVTQTSPQKKRTTSQTTTQQLVVEDGAAATAPQVVTLLHRLSGLKMFRLLMRSGDVKAVSRLDENFQITGDVHTNVIAGLALDDGETVAAWLPEVDAEIAPLVGFRSQVAPVSPRARSATVVNVPEALPGFGNWFEPPNLTVIARDRRRLAARYVGLDGVTGLSILKLAQHGQLRNVPTSFAEEESLAVGQTVRLLGPEPVNQSSTATTNRIYVRVGETKGAIKRITRSPSGTIARVEIESPKVTAANIGGVAINEAGETVGIVEAVKDTGASILPAAQIRNAAKRVLTRQASVPKPWLGVSGEPLGSFATEQLIRSGWEPAMVQSLFSEHYGILLTSVLPGSPAFKASLKPGDVILRVNDGEVKSGDHFSWLIEEAGPGANLVFTVAKREKNAEEDVEVKLGEAPSPFFGLRAPYIPRELRYGLHPDFRAGVRQLAGSAALYANGLETITLRPGVAARFGSKGGLLVIDVQPATAAYKAGLRPGDVIETINGEPVTPSPEAITLTSAPGQVYSFMVVRNKQKLEVSFVIPETKK
ncbi:MAG TPA: PDZ domain-containing protein [Pyrinomonadaceae bacterium]|jgi:serine protease Do